MISKAPLVERMEHGVTFHLSSCVGTNQVSILNHYFNMTIHKCINNIIAVSTPWIAAASATGALLTVFGFTIVTIAGIISQRRAAGKHSQ